MFHFPLGQSAVHKRKLDETEAFKSKKRCMETMQEQQDGCGAWKLERLQQPTQILQQPTQILQRHFSTNQQLNERTHALTGFSNNCNIDLNINNNFSYLNNHRYDDQVYGYNNNIDCNKNDLFNVSCHNRIINNNGSDDQMMMLNDENIPDVSHKYNNKNDFIGFKSEMCFRNADLDSSYGCKRFF